METERVPMSDAVPPGHCGTPSGSHSEQNVRSSASRVCTLPLGKPVDRVTHMSATRRRIETMNLLRNTRETLEGHLETERFRGADHDVFGATVSAGRCSVVEADSTGR